MSNQLSELANTLDVDSITLIRLAKKLNIKCEELTKDDIENIKRALTGYYDLSNKDIRSIDAFLYSDKAADLLKEAAVLVDYLDGKEQKKYLDFISDKLFELMEDHELKSRIKPATIYETIMNLGVIRIYRTSSNTEKQEKQLPVHLMGFDPKISKNIIKRHMAKALEVMPVESITDFDNANKELTKMYKQFKEEAEGDLEHSIEEAFSEVRRIPNFGKELWYNSKGNVKPRMHQIVRIHEAVKNGNKRILCADTTSAGKTLTAVAIKGLLDQVYMESEGRKAKALVVGPRKALESAFSGEEINRYNSELNLSKQNAVLIDDKTDLSSLLNYDYILLNTEKFSMNDKKYVNAVMNITPHIDMVMVDECHNFKNLEANRTGEFRRLIESTETKNFVMLSASPIPNRLKDAGFLLYMLNPSRYRHYSREPFDYTIDKNSIKNAINSGSWYSFPREDLARLFQLPELRFGIPELGIEEPHVFEYSDDDARKYFEKWKDDTQGIAKIVSLCQTLLRSESTFSEVERLCKMIVENEPDAQVGIFSYYTDGFTEVMKNRLDDIFPGRVEMITGSYPSGDSVKERIAIAKRYNKGELGFLVNTSQTMSESISLISEDRPNYIILAEPSMVPATYDQIIGRFYRIGQEAPVSLIEMIPHSDLLSELMIKEKHKQESRGIKYRKNWESTNVFEDKHKIRQEKADLIDMVLRGMDAGDLVDIANASDASPDTKAFVSLPMKKDSEESVNKRFNEGLKRTRKCIGMPLKTLTEGDEKEYMIRSYADDEWDITSSADTNRAIVEMIKTIEEDEGRTLENILDWGCGSACLARTLKRPIHNLDAMSEQFIKGKDICKELGIYDGMNIDDYFTVADMSEKTHFEDGYFDLVSSAYALQYNAQGYKHERDVEKILIETNRILKDRGYGILALPNQATSDEDLENLKEVLMPRYGFNVVFSDFVRGRGYNEASKRRKYVFDGFHSIIYQKIEEKNQLEGEDDIFIFPPYKFSGIGGLREKELEKKLNKSYKKEKIIADEFRCSDNKLLGEILGDSMKEYNFRR